MDYLYACLICVGFLAFTLRAPADIVWSGERNLSIYGQYIDLNSDSLIDRVMSYPVTGNNSLSPADLRGYVYAKVDGSGVDGANRILVDSLNGQDAALAFGTLISRSTWRSGGRHP